jgi:hypothetical protein
MPARQPDPRELQRFTRVPTWQARCTCTRRVGATGRGPNLNEEEPAMAKKAGAERKKKIEDLKVKDVQTAEAQAVTGGKTSYSDFQITKYTDKSSPVLAS